MVWHWDRFPRVVVKSLPFGVLKTELDKAMTELIWCWQHSCFGQEAGLGDHQRCLPTNIPVTFFSLLEGNQSLPMQLYPQNLEPDPGLLFPTLLHF